MTRSAFNMQNKYQQNLCDEFQPQILETEKIEKMIFFH